MIVKLIMGQTAFDQMNAIPGVGGAGIVYRGRHNEARALFRTGPLLDGLPYHLDTGLAPDDVFEQDHMGNLRRIMGKP